MPIFVVILPETLPCRRGGRSFSKLAAIIDVLLLRSDGIGTLLSVMQPASVTIACLVDARFEPKANDVLHGEQQSHDTCGDAGYHCTPEALEVCITFAISRQSAEDDEIDNCDG